MNAISFCIALCVALLWGVQAVVFKMLLRKYDTITVMVLSALLYAATLLVFVAFAPPTTAATVPGLGSGLEGCFRTISRMPRRDVLLVFATELFGMLIANLLYYHVLTPSSSPSSSSPATAVVTAITFSSPVFTLLVGYAVLGEKVAPQGLLGIALVTAGLFLVAQN